VIFIGIDDTDNKESRGTGHMSRMLAQELRSEIEVYGITRHQLLVDPRIPYTAKNSCAALHINANGDPASGGTANSGIDLTALAERVADFVQSESAPGSDPAICVAQDVPMEVSQFGHRVQHDVVTQDEARSLAERHGIILRGLGGTEDGVIGVQPSNDQTKEVTLTWGQVTDPASNVILDYSAAGDSLKLVSTLPDLDTRDDWVQGIQRIEVTRHP